MQKDLARVDAMGDGHDSRTAMENQTLIEHGKTCKKVPHVPDEGWLHAADDDGPYFVDSLRYCGRCHYWIG